MKSKGQSQSKFTRFMAVPLRALGKARDLYVRGIMGCAARANYTNGLPTPLPGSRSAAVGSAGSSRRSSNYGSDDDYSELIRAASVRRLGHQNEIAMFLHQHQSQIAMRAAAPANGGLPKSCSAGMASIDEESACEFGDDEHDYPRSKSCAVPISKFLN